MKVLFINSVIDYGSTGKIVRDLSDGLIKRGHEVSVAYGRNKIADDSSFYFGNQFGFAIHYAMSRMLGRHGLHSSIQTKKLIEYIKKSKPDVIHLHNLHGYYLNVKMLFKYLNSTDIQLMWTLHDCWSFSGSSAYFDYSGCDIWNKGCVVCKDTHEYPYNQFGLHQKQNFKWKKELFSSSNHLKIITVSNWLNELTHTTFMNKHSIDTIYNGIKENTFKPTQQTNHQEKIQILGVANIWEKRKGLEDFVLLRSILDDRYEITLIGLSSKQVEDMPKGIIGIERTSNVEELVNYYSNADVYLNLSYEETMGLTTIESLACGTPVVVYDKTAVPELVNEKVGMVVKSGDIDLLKESIDLVVKKKLKKSADLRDHALKFTNDIMISNYMKVYEKYEKN